MKKISIFLIILYFCNTASFAAEKNVVIYDEPKDFSQSVFYDVDGNKHHLSDYNDKNVVLFFWSQHCIPCIKSLPQLNKFTELTKDDIKLIMISSSTEWNNALESQEVLKKYKANNLISYIDKNSQLASKLKVYATPRMFIFNKDGELIAQIKGGANWKDEKIIEYIYDLIKNNS